MQVLHFFLDGLRFNTFQLFIWNSFEGNNSHSYPLTEEKPTSFLMAVLSWTISGSRSAVARKAIISSFIKAGVSQDVQHTGSSGVSARLKFFSCLRIVTSLNSLSLVDIQVLWFSPLCVHVPVKSLLSPLNTNKSLCVLYETLPCLITETGGNTIGRGHQIHEVPSKWRVNVLEVSCKVCVSCSAFIVHLWRHKEGSEGSLGGNADSFSLQDANRHILNQSNSLAKAWAHYRFKEIVVKCLTEQSLLFFLLEELIIAILSIQTHTKYDLRAEAQRENLQSK